MPVHLTAQQARALGVDATHGSRVVSPRRRTTRKAVPASECSENRCHTCGNVYKTEPGQVRHAAATGHLRFDCVLAVTVTAQ
jgi:hypothetical protein